MDVAVASQSKTTQESVYSQDSVPDQIFVDFLGPYRHGRVRCQSSTATPSYYYDSKHTGDLRWRPNITK